MLDANFPFFVQGNKLSQNPYDGTPDQSGKVLISIICLVGGFAFPILWLGVPYILFLVWAETRRSTVRMEDTRFPNLQGGANDNDWQCKSRECLDSPSEEAFFDAMTKDFDLRPVGDCFQGSGLTLRMQVSVLRYRLDFLVDDTLVVEIDGAKWHGSPEAMARDQTRDKDLEAIGYTVLRIPAKIALYNPDEATRLVREMRPKAAMRQKHKDNANRHAFRRSFNPIRLVKTANAGISGFVEKADEIMATAERSSDEWAQKKNKK